MLGSSGERGAPGPELVGAELLAVDELLVAETDAQRHDLDARGAGDLVRQVARAVGDDADVAAGGRGRDGGRLGVGHVVTLPRRSGRAERRRRAACRVRRRCDEPPRRQHEDGAHGDDAAEPGESGDARLEHDRTVDECASRPGLCSRISIVDVPLERPAPARRVVDEAAGTVTVCSPFGKGQLRRAHLQRDGQRHVGAVVELEVGSVLDAPVIVRVDGSGAVTAPRTASTSRPTAARRASKSAWSRPSASNAVERRRSTAPAGGCR